MQKHAVAKVGTIIPGDRQIVKVGKRSLGIFFQDGEYFAVRNVCAHQGGPVCEGKLSPAHRAAVNSGSSRVYGKTKEYLDYDTKVLICPWHGWEYDLRSGVCLADPMRRVAVYPVTIEGDDVVVTLDD